MGPVPEARTTSSTREVDLVLGKHYKATEEHTHQAVGHGPAPGGSPGGRGDRQRRALQPSAAPQTAASTRSSTPPRRPHDAAANAHPVAPEPAPAPAPVIRPASVTLARSPRRTSTPTRTRPSRSPRPSLAAASTGRSSPASARFVPPCRPGRREPRRRAAQRDLRPAPRRIARRQRGHRRHRRRRARRRRDLRSRADGPMQFLPSTWKAYAKDGNGDGKSNQQNIFDAALTTRDPLRGSRPGPARSLVAGHRDPAVQQLDGVREQRPRVRPQLLTGLRSESGPRLLLRQECLQRSGIHRHVGSAHEFACGMHRELRSADVDGREPGAGGSRTDRRSAGQIRAMDVALSRNPRGVTCEREVACHGI